MNQPADRNCKGIKGRVYRMLSGEGEGEGEVALTSAQGMV